MKICNAQSWTRVNFLDPTRPTFLELMTRDPTSTGHYGGKQITGFFLPKMTYCTLANVLM